MQNEVISDKQGISITATYTLGSALVLGTGLIAKQDAWVSVIFAVILTIPIVMMYARILSLFPGNDIFDISQIIFGKVIGKIFSILFIWFAFFLGTIVLRIFGLFINSMSLSETPQIVPMTMVGILCGYGVISGVEVLGRWAEFFLNFIIVYIIISTLLLFNKMDVNNILPVMYNGIKPVLIGIFAAVAYPFAETLVMVMIFSNLKDKKSPYRIFFWGIIVSGVIVLTATIRNILTLGNVVSKFYFPSYIAVSRVNIGDFLQRLEILVALVLLIAGYMQIVSCLLAACRGISKLFGCDNYRFIVWPITLIMINYSYFIIKNTIEMEQWAVKIWRYYAIGFEILLPLIIYIGAEIKVRRNKKDNSSGYI